MKTTLPLALLALSLQLSTAKVSSWTAQDGRSASFELINVTEVSGELVGEFKMANGKMVTLKASQLDAKELPRLEEFKSTQVEEEAQDDEVASNDIYYEFLKDNLIALDRKEFSDVEEYKSPTKYYLFYKTASWCPPCQKFTPSLVKFYKRYKSKYPDAFEIILVSSDKNQSAMLKYAEDKKMEWPHIKLKSLSKFSSKHRLKGGGIPNTILTDTEGNVIEQSYKDGKYQGPEIAMTALEDLLDNIEK